MATRQQTRATGIKTRWVNSDRQLADVLTKATVPLQQHITPIVPTQAPRSGTYSRTSALHALPISGFRMKHSGWVFQSFSTLQNSWIRRQRLTWTDAFFPPWWPGSFEPPSLSHLESTSFQTLSSDVGKGISGARQLLFTPYSRWYR